MNADGKRVALVSLGGSLLLALVSALVAGVLRTPAASNTDGHWYATMAKGGLAATPYAWRVMAPFIVHVLPLPHWMTFYAIAVLCCAGTAWMLALYVLRCGYGPHVASLSAGLFLADYWCAAGYLHDPFAVDPIGLLTVAAVFYLLALDRPVMAAAVALCGTLDHETSILLGAAFFGWGWPRWSKALAWGAGVTAAAFAVHLAVQSLAPAATSATAAGAVISEVIGTLHTRLHQLRYSVGAVLALFTTAWGIGAVLGWARPADLWRHLTRPECLAFAVVAIPATFLLGQNGSRLFVYAFPALLPGMALGAASLLDTVRRPDVAWLAGSALALVLMVAMPFGLHAKAGAAALVLCVAGALWLRARSIRGASPVGGHRSQYASSEQ